MVKKLVFSDKDDLYDFEELLSKEMVSYAENNIIKSFTHILEDDEQQVKK